ncbi:MAG: amino acid ABC transporter ATP-binding protein [Lachnospiraceae bacterium]|nr:amino acid ABC transporter ATP-binding protein [Lachnospiraceae bacterium]
MSLLEVSHVKKQFDGQTVLEDISLSLEEGQVLGIIGPSGSGKSTLLRCATMLERVEEGAISYDGHSLVHTSQDGVPIYAKGEELKKIRSMFGIVFQNYNLFPHFSVIRNIMEAPVHVLKQKPEEARQKAEMLLKKMGLEDKADAYPCQLSGGQQQRVSIARALALDPRVLFFDEPTSALDPELTGEILKVIRELAEDHMTMVIVTHEMSFARDVSDHLIFMEGGYIVEQGKPEDVIHNPVNPRTKEFLKRFYQE